MTDWHSHVLPKMDDGSKSVEESVALLNELAAQGVNTVVASPHFYANDEAVEHFIKRRQKAFNELLPHLNNDLPKILLGAEVSYYSGISRMENLEKLKIEGTDLILLEMPFCRWTEYTVRELLELSASGKFKIMLAHVERYAAFLDAAMLERLYDSEILMQSNASFFTALFKKKKALKLLKNQKIHFIGSDCHNTHSRPPKFKAAYDYIENKLGKEFLAHINENAKTFSYK